MNLTKIRQAKLIKAQKLKEAEEVAQARHVELVNSLESTKEYIAEALLDSQDNLSADLKGSITELADRFTEEARLMSVSQESVGKAQQEAFYKAAAEINQLAEDIKSDRRVDTDSIKQAISSIKIPEPKMIVPKQEQKDYTDKFDGIRKGVAELTKILTEKEAKPEDFTPVRRVRKVGNRLEFDDSSWANGASGGTNNTLDLIGNHTILKAAVSVNTSDSTVVPASPGKKIKILSMVLVSAGSVNLTWESDATPISGAIPLIANSGYVLPAVSPGQGDYMETASGEALKIGLSSNVQVSGHITYYLS